MVRKNSLRKGTIISALVFVIGVIALISMYTLSVSNLSEDTARRATEGSSLTEVKIGPSTSNFLYFGCGQTDFAHREVTGRNADGDTVHAIVCGGVFKAATIRYP